MPYFHKSCGGEIRWYPPLPVAPKCRKCGKTWNPLVVYGAKRADMIFRMKHHVPAIKLERGQTSYAKWADSAPPGVAFIASKLPNWPRWLRLTAFLGTVIGLSGLFYGLSLINTLAVVLGVIVVALSPIFITFIMAKKRKK